MPFGSRLRPPNLGVGESSRAYLVVAGDGSGGQREAGLVGRTADS
jgi:hypothetical protein